MRPDNGSQRSGCFFCRFLGKTKMVCSLSKDVDINLFNIFDFKAKNCPAVVGGGTMEYKEFKTDNIKKETVEDKDVFTAKVLNSADFINLSADSLENLEDQFHKKIDDYLKLCESYKKDPYQYK